MTPMRLSAPVEPVVSLDDIKAHLRVTHDDQDMLIQQLTDAAVAHLDGWRGVLGRCIMPQTWRVDLDRGCHALPFPDVIQVTGGEWDERRRRITMEEAGPVDVTCALPEDALPAIQSAVKIWVQMQYDGLAGPDRAAYEAAFHGLISPLRWTA